MNNFEKIDRVLEIILNCQTPPRMSFVDIIAELKKQKLDISTNELIGILYKLEKDDFIKVEIIDSNNIRYYFSTFGGRFFFDNGGYLEQNESKLSLKKSIKDTKRAERFITRLTIINILIISILTGLNYRATNKANDNKEEVNILNSRIERLSKTNDSLVYILISKSIPKEKKTQLKIKYLVCYK